MMKANPHCCEEAALGVPGYIPCNKPAVSVVKQPDGNKVAMCVACAWHNVNNRGGELDGHYNPDDYVSPFKDIPEDRAAIGQYFDMLNKQDEDRKKQEKAEALERDIARAVEREASAEALNKLEGLEWSDGD